MGKCSKNKIAYFQGGQRGGQVFTWAQADDAARDKLQSHLARNSPARPGRLQGWGCKAPGNAPHGSNGRQRQLLLPPSPLQSYRRGCPHQSLLSPEPRHRGELPLLGGGRGVARKGEDSESNQAGRHKSAKCATQAESCGQRPGARRAERRLSPRTAGKPSSSDRPCTTCSGSPSRRLCGISWPRRGASCKEGEQAATQWSAVGLHRGV